MYKSELSAHIQIQKYLINSAFAYHGKVSLKVLISLAAIDSALKLGFCGYERVPVSKVSYVR